MAEFSVGGDAGREWHMRTPVSNIIWMKVYYDTWIRGMDTIYICDVGQITDHYGGYADEYSAITLDSHEYFNSITGKIGKTDQGTTVINQFTLVTNNGKSVTFGTGDVAKDFCLRADKIMDFFGRGDKDGIYAIGVHFVPVK